MDNGLVLTEGKKYPVSLPGLNPCCSGQWSSTNITVMKGTNNEVLILVVVDNGLVLYGKNKLVDLETVLILVVVDNGLVPMIRILIGSMSLSLNPCCSGQWSSTWY